MNAETRPRHETRSTTMHAQNPLALSVSAAVTALTLTVAFVLLALGVEQFWVVFIVGFAVVLPASIAAVQYRQVDRTRSVGPAEGSDADAAMADLRLRYVRGDLTDGEFERRLERLLESDPE